MSNVLCLNPTIHSGRGFIITLLGLRRRMNFKIAAVAPGVPQPVALGSVLLQLDEYSRNI